MSELSAGSLADLSAESGLRIENGDAAVAVFKIGDKVHAIADRCSHAEASLSEGELFDGEVECPRHGAVFDVATGQAVTLPASRPVAVYTTSVRDGEVFIEIPEEDT